MLFNLLAFVFIVMITLYLATQGMMSSLLALVTATFASILAMGLMEATEGIIASWRPDFARGVTFLLLFFLAFSACRIAADMLVPKNIKLPLLINRIVSGAIGFFTAMVVIGTTIIGLEMLPLHTVILGYDRFPGANGMQGEKSGSAAAPTNTWLAPERLVQAIWSGVSGRGLGGNMAFGDMHPDIDVESYGYRNTVQYQARHALVPDLFQVTSAWAIPDSDTNGKTVMVRTSVKKGDKPEHGSYDSDNNYFRITPAEVRLITDKGRQYYPVGYLRKGHTPEKLNLNDAMVDDYQGPDAVVNQDWLFIIRSDENPEWIEMKELSRVNLAGMVKETRGKDLATTYPTREWEKDVSTYEVTVNNKGIPISGAKVYILRPTALRSTLNGEVRDSYAQLVKITGDVRDGANGWTSGSPFAGMVREAQNAGNRQYVDEPPETAIDLNLVMHMLISGKLQSDPQQNFNTIPEYITNTIMDSVLKNSIVKQGITGPDGKVSLEKIPAGQFVIVVSAKTEKGVYVWVEGQSFVAKKDVTHTFETSQGPYLKIEQ